MKRIVLFFVLGYLLTTFTAIFPASSNSTEALSGSEFQAGRIIDDAVFFNSNAMLPAQIQSFLDARVPVCDTNGQVVFSGSQTRAEWAAANGRPLPPYTCLKDYTQTISGITNSGSDLCSGSITGGTKSAAQLIYDVAKACDINPQVLIVLLQKEQSLITDDWPWPRQYEIATGYGCPDTAPCNEEYYGFFNQVYQAAQAFRRYEANPNSYNYTANRNNFIYYHPSLGVCGGSNVFIENQATANLYIYTPYQPNQAALNNLYGIGDGCSAYGNRNFWRIFHDWFGSPILVRNIIPVIYDNNTDVTGETASVGFRLSHKPNSSVSFDILISPSNLSTAEKRITITPENWDRPDKHIVILKGRYNPALSGNHTLYMFTGSMTSADTRFNLSSNITPDVPILHQDDSNAVYRLYNTSLGTHLFTGSIPERDNLISQGWRDEGVGFYSCRAGNVVYARLTKDDDYRIAQYGSATYNALIDSGYEFEELISTGSTNGRYILYVKHNATNNTSLYTLSQTEGDSEGYVQTGILPICDDNVDPVYRLYSSSRRNHFYTTSTFERNSAREIGKYRYEGVGFYTSSGGTTPVYRLYSPTSSNHFYTLSEQERDSAVNSAGYREEGVGFFVNSSDTNDIYRLYSPTSSNHFYTLSEQERDSAVNSAGYREEATYPISY